MSNPAPHIYLLPNLLTTASLFTGFYAVINSINGNFDTAAIAIFVAMIFDGLDGRVARMTNTQSEFGAQYDSMSDLISFGMAPSLIMFNFALTDLGKLGWLASFIYVAAAALRLARFNAELNSQDSNYFRGLASPAAAALVAGFVWFCEDYDLLGGDYALVAAFVLASSGILMISNFRYHSFKQVAWHGKVPFFALLVILVVFIVVATAPSLVLFVVFAMYALTGPFMTYKNKSKVTLEDVVGDTKFSSDVPDPSDTTASDRDQKSGE